MESESEKNKIIFGCSYWIKRVLKDHFQEFFGDPSGFKRRFYRINEMDQHFYQEVVNRTKLVFNLQISII